MTSDGQKVHYVVIGSSNDAAIDVVTTDTVEAAFDRFDKKRRDEPRMTWQVISILETLEGRTSRSILCQAHPIEDDAQVAR